MGAGIWGYDVAKEQLVYVQFYVSGANAVIRYDVKSPNAVADRVWKGRMMQVSDVGKAGEGTVECHRISETHCVFRVTADVAEGVEGEPGAE